MLKLGFRGIGQSLQCQPGGQLCKSPKASGHYMNTPFSSETFGIFDLFLLVFVFANLNSMLAKSKLAFFSQNLVIMLNKHVSSIKLSRLHIFYKSMYLFKIFLRKGMCSFPFLLSITEHKLIAHIKITYYFSLQVTHMVYLLDFVEFSAFFEIH